MVLLFEKDTECLNHVDGIGGNTSRALQLQLLDYATEPYHRL